MSPAEKKVFADMAVEAKIEADRERASEPAVDSQASTAASADLSHSGDISQGELVPKDSAVDILPGALQLPSGTQAPYNLRACSQLGVLIANDDSIKTAT